MNAIFYGNKVPVAVASHKRIKQLIFVVVVVEIEAKMFLLNRTFDADANECESFSFPFHSFAPTASRGGHRQFLHIRKPNVIES